MTGLSLPVVMSLRKFGNDRCVIRRPVPGSRLTVDIAGLTPIGQCLAGEDQVFEPGDAQKPLPVKELVDQLRHEILRTSARS